MAFGTTFTKTFTTFTTSGHCIIGLLNVEREDGVMRYDLNVEANRDIYTMHGKIYGLAA